MAQYYKNLEIQDKDTNIKVITEMYTGGLYVAIYIDDKIDEQKVMSILSYKKMLIALIAQATENKAKITYGQLVKG